jgi:hypothetical protein
MPDLPIPTPSATAGHLGLTRTTRLDLAGLGIRISSSDPAWHDAVTSHWGAFLGPGDDGGWALHLTDRYRLSPQGWEPSEAPWTASAPDHEGGQFTLRASEIEVSVDVGAREARVATAHGRALEAFLRVLLPIALEDGLVFHATMLRSGGAAVLGVGPSGAGKTTLASLLPDLSCADEHAAVRIIDGRPTAFSLPFWEARPARARLARVYLLEHGPRPVTTRVTAEQAFRALLAHVLWPMGPASARAQSFSMLAEVCRQVPVSTLAFRPDPTVRDILCFD